MQNVYLDCSGLPHSIPIRSDLPNTIYIEASSLQNVLSDFLEQLPNAIAEGLKANPVENRVMPKIAEVVYSTHGYLEAWQQERLIKEIKEKLSNFTT